MGDGSEEHQPHIPWKYCNMEELLKFLQERCGDGFLFPINPVWPARHPGWFEIYQKLKDVEGVGAWLDAELCQMIETIAGEYPDGFVRLVLESSPELRRSTQKEFYNDVDPREEGYLRLYRKTIATRTYNDLLDTPSELESPRRLHSFLDRLTGSFRVKKK